MFLKIYTHVISSINKMFQSINSHIQKMYSEVEPLYLKILNNFVKPMYVNTDFNIEENIENKDVFKSRRCKLRSTRKKKISETKFSHSELTEFTNYCVSFCIEFCKQITKCFNFKDTFLKEMSSIDPHNDEFREFRHKDFKQYFQTLQNINCEDFWARVSKITRVGNDLVFSTLTKFVSSIVCLPSSSAIVERIFSKVNLNKTKYRNRHENGTFEGILFTQDYLLVKR